MFSSAPYQRCPRAYLSARVRLSVTLYATRQASSRRRTSSHQPLLLTDRARQSSSLTLSEAQPSLVTWHCLTHVLEFQPRRLSHFSAATLPLRSTPLPVQKLTSM